MEKKDFSLKKGIVIEFLVKKYLILDLKTKEQIYAQYKGRLKNKVNKIDIKIGDIVLYEYKSENFLIYNILPRKNFLSRPNIANIDQVFLIFSLIKPCLQFKLLDKFLLILAKKKLKVILIFTKIDLLNKEKLFFFKRKISYYEKFYSIYFVNSQNKLNLSFLFPFFKNKLTIFTGQTGVGKSTLINSLTNSNIATQVVSNLFNRGKHTTKNSKLYIFKEGYIADTPGFSKLFLFNIDLKEIKNFYNDFLMFSYKCFFGESCLHIKESCCGVKEAYQKGLILNLRYKNYLSFCEEISKKNKKNF